MWYRPKSKSQHQLSTLQDDFQSHMKSLTYSYKRLKSHVAAQNLASHPPPRSQPTLNQQIWVQFQMRAVHISNFFPKTSPGATEDLMADQWQHLLTTLSDWLPNLPYLTSPYVTAIATWKLPKLKDQKDRN